MKKIGKFHVLTNTDLQHRFSHVELTTMAVAGGADTIQFRSKSGSTRDMIDSALQMKTLCKKAGVPLIINDRIDVAIAVGADGVHIGQDDFPIPLARKLLGPDAIIGGSAGSMEEALKCLSDGSDYIGVGPVYGTSSKSDAGPATGVDNLRAIAERIALPVIAIGGIKASDIKELMKAGAYGVAVISAVCCEDDPERAALKIKTEMDKYGK
ncbi:MAG: thiamine phosphate synthase [Deltaproteobacteria bacterium]|nr:thiamine phosphate synthase [Deltaproteobacteria bacterium]